MDVLNSFKLDNTVSVVTGGYGYLGRSIVTALSEAGSVVIVAARDKDKFDRSFSEVNKKNIYFERMDVSSTKSIKRAYQNINQRYHQINILVNNAAYCEGRSAELTDKVWNRGIDGILNNVYRCLRESIHYLKKNEYSSIINIASMYGSIAPDFRIYHNNQNQFNPPNYGVAKAGIIQLTKYFAVYLAKDNIRVNCLSPGPFPSIETQQSKSFVNDLSQKNPMGRIGHPDELKGVIVLLASKASSYLTGQNIIIDGGWSIW